MTVKRLTRVEAKARTREQLLAAAARTFARKGYAAASVEEIAEAAGYSVGAVYSNFGGKAELLTELLSTHSSGQIAEVARLFADLENGTGSPADMLGTLVARTAGVDNDLTLLQAELWLSAVRDPELMAIYADRMREPLAALTDVMRTALARIGRADDVPADEVATVVLALFQGLVRLRRTDAGQVPEELIGRAMRWLFMGIAADR